MTLTTERKGYRPVHQPLPLNTQNLESTPGSASRGITTTDAVSYSDAIEGPSIKIVCKRDTTALLTVSENITCLQYAISIMFVDTQRQNLQPTVPDFGVVAKVAEMAPPNIKPADGIVHLPSEIEKVVAVPALPSVGGALRHNQ